MMVKSQYDQILVNIAEIYHELYSIIETIRSDFEEESRQDPCLTMPIVNYHLDIIKNYYVSFQNRINNRIANTYQGWSLEKQIESSRQEIRSFHREFDNPFLGSQRWYQKITRLQDQLTEQARELDTLIEKF